MTGDRDVIFGDYPNLDSIESVPDLNYHIGTRGYYHLSDDSKAIIKPKPSNYEDTCSYNGDSHIENYNYETQGPKDRSLSYTRTSIVYVFKCGNNCNEIEVLDIRRRKRREIVPVGACNCGDETIEDVTKGQICCIPSNTICNEHNLGVCDKGRTIPMTAFCENSKRSLQCYNSYQDSEVIGKDSHYTCTKSSSCVPIMDMCQGINWCDGLDHQICDNKLICPPSTTKKSLPSGHYFCARDLIANRGEGEELDRSAVNNVVFENSALVIQPYLSQFLPCMAYPSPGVMCGSDCLESRKWCGDYSEPCGAQKITTNDRRICSHPSVFRNISCFIYDRSESVYAFGIRCSGNNMGCIYPWYVRQIGNIKNEPEEPWTETCNDKSDQYFNVGRTCAYHLEQHKMDYNREFGDSIKTKVWDRNQMIFNERTVSLDEWLEKQPDKKYRDPHNCQDSCLKRGPDCEACTNPDYFKCTSSNICLHPKLRCDGHPQCPGAEDEDPDLCYTNHFRNKIEKIYSCQSIVYENMRVYATRCNFVKECVNGEDEEGCEVKIEQNIIIGVVCLIIMFLYLALSLSAYRNVAQKLDNQENEDTKLNLQDIIKILEGHLNIQDETAANILLLNSIHTRTVVEKKTIFLQFYDLVAEKQSQNESEIYHYLKTNFDPSIVQLTIDSKFPGCTEGFKNRLEKAVGKKIFENMTDCINSSERSKFILAKIISVVKMEFKFFDLFKDLGLSFYLLGLIGGIQAIIELPTNFKSVIVVVMFGSIFGPMVLSSLHLAANNPTMIFGHSFDKNDSSRFRRYLSVPLCFVLSVTNQIFLTCLYEENKEKMRRLAQSCDSKVIKKIKWCRKIKTQIIKFYQLELGKKSNFNCLKK